MRRPLSLASRLALAFGGLFLAVSAASAALAFWRAGEAAERAYAQRMVSLVGAIPPSFVSNPDILARTKQLVGADVASVTTPGTLGSAYVPVMESTLPPDEHRGLLKFLELTPEHLSGRSQSVKLKGRKYRVFGARGGGKPGHPTILLIVAQEEIDRARRSAAAPVLLAAVLGAGAAVLLAWLLAASVARPVRRLAVEAGRAAEGRLEFRHVSGGGREIEELSESLERMTAALARSRAELVKSERAAAAGQMAAALAHEVRNPLTGAKMTVEMLLGAHAMTEPGAGTDLGAVSTTAKQDGDEYVLNGSKIFITNGGVADIVLVLASTDRAAKAKGLSLFIVEKGTAGFSVGKTEHKLGIRASNTAELVFQDCRVPAINLLGAEGAGFKIGLGTLDGGRIGIAAQAVGIGRAALEAAVAYAKEREQFGKPIGTFQAIQWMIADSATELDAARLLYLRAAQVKDSGGRFSSEAAMAKLFASETASRAADRAIQIHGGYGYSTEYAPERHYRDARITRIYEGTSEVMRMVIAGGLLR